MQEQGSAGGMKRFLLATAVFTALALPAMADELHRHPGQDPRRGDDHLGVRDSALPFSYKLPDGSPAGYAVDLCRALVEDVSAALGRKPVGIVYKTVTAEDRIDRVVSGDVDIECGSTTRNKQRQQRVAFSPVFFIAGTKLMVSREVDDPQLQGPAGQDRCGDIGHDQRTGHARPGRPAGRAHHDRYRTQPHRFLRHAARRPGGRFRH